VTPTGAHRAEAGPLAGIRVLVTAGEPEPLSALLRVRGAMPVAVPTIAIRAADPAPLDAALAHAWDWIVVTSANGARAVLSRLPTADAAGASRSARWAAVGPRTAEVLRAGGIDATRAPMDGTGVGLAAAMEDVAGRRVLLARARAAARDLPDALRARGAEVHEVVAYETEEGPESSRAGIAEALQAGVDAAVFTSGSTVRGLVRLAGDPARALGDAVVVVIGPTTAEVARRAGLTPHASSDRTPGGVVAALESALARSPLRRSGATGARG
jgi:uroporphyrinogen-III synthase